MAKRAKKQMETVQEPSKSSLIREYLAAHPSAMPKEVVDALAAKGVTVIPNMVSMLKAKAKIKSAVAKKQPNNSALEHLSLLYRAARGRETPADKVTEAFVNLVDALE